MKTLKAIILLIYLIIEVCYSQQISTLSTSFYGSPAVRIGYPLNSISIKINNLQKDTIPFALIQIKTDKDIEINNILPFLRPDSKIKLVDSLSFGNHKQFTFMVINLIPKNNRYIEYKFNVTNQFSFSPKISYGLLVFTSNSYSDLANIILELTKSYWQGFISKDEMTQFLISSMITSYSSTNNRWKGNEKPIKMMCEELASLINGKLSSMGLPLLITGKILYDKIESIFEGKTQSVNSITSWNNKEEKYTPIGQIYYQSMTFSKRASYDPNEKISLKGYGDGNYINKNESLIYRINFENKSTATAPAYKIIVMDTLSDLFIMLSRLEPFGMMAIEANVCSNP